MRLDGVRILDLTRLLPGPYATQLLADAGADVIKVEEPGRGDYARFSGAGDDGPGVFEAVNRGKRSAALDLKSEAGRDAFHRLAADADAVVEGFRPGVTERLGIDYDSVCEHNPDIVYTSLTGYGATGPHRDRAGHDLNYIAMAGLLDMTRPAPDGEPTIPGYQVADMGGGLFAAFATVGALLSRELGGGGGEHVDVSMTDVVASFSQSIAGEALTGGDPRPGETTLTGELPCYDVYETEDGRYVTLGALEPPFFAAFCEAIDRPELASDHLSQDPEVREALRDELAGEFRSRTQAEWEDLLGEGTMTAPVRTPAEALSSSLFRERGLIEEGGDVPRVSFPAIPSGGLDRQGGEPPGLGEHTEEVLREAGLADDEVAALLDAAG